MSKINQILNSFRNPATRNLAIVLGLGDLAAIAGLIIAIVYRSFPGVVLTLSLYALVYFYASNYIKIRAAFPISEDNDDEL